jgi:hypothetical protein
LTQTDTAVHYTRDELIREIDTASRRAIGKSAKQLALAYRSGRLKEPHRVAHLIGLLSLFAADDPLFGSQQ